MMIRPQKLDFRIWKATVGQWGPLIAVFKRFDKNTADILTRKTRGLLNHLSRQQPDCDVAKFIRKTLPIAAELLTAKQYEETLELVARLEDSGISTKYVLTKGVPALGQCCTDVDSFSTNLVYLEALIGHMRNHDMDVGKPLMVAVQAGAKGLHARQLGNSILFAARLAETGVDPTEILRFSLPAAAAALNGQQFRLAVSLATYAAQRSLTVTDLLATQLPTVSQAVSPDELTAGLRLALHFDENDVAIKDFFKTGLVALVEVSETKEEFTRNLDLISALLMLLKEDNIQIDPPLTAMTGGCKHPDDFRVNVETLCRFSLQVNQHNVPPGTLLQHGFPLAVLHTPTSFRAALNNLATIVVRLRGANINDNLLEYIIEYGLDRVAKISQTEQDYRENLVVVMKSFRQLALSNIDPACHEKALETIRETPDVYVNVVNSMDLPIQLQGGLACLYELATRPEFDWRRLAVKRVVELAQQTVEAQQEDQTVKLEYDEMHGPQLKIEPRKKASAYKQRRIIRRSRKPSGSI